MKKVQVLGTGCPKCQETLDNAKQAAGALGIQVEFEKVDKPAALAVDGEVKVSGRIPTVDEIKAWLASTGQPG